jgi:ABC-type nitrate/sulfonate/bicarbonate transport system permease component
MRSLLLSRFSGFLVVGAVLLLWQEVADHHLVDPFLVPAFSTVIKSWVTAMRDGTLRDALGSTLSRFFFSYGCAVVIGVVLGLLIGYWRVFYALLEPLIELIRPIPPPALVPIYILLLGIEDRMKITVTIVSAVFPIIVSTIQGVRSVDPLLVDTARTFGYSGLAVVRRIILPASLPSIFAGMRISLATALIVTIFAEMLAGDSGVGYFILNAQRSFAIPAMYAGVLTLAVIGYAFNRLFVSAEHLLLRWHFDRTRG